MILDMSREEGKRINIKNEIQYKLSRITAIFGQKYTSKESTYQRTPWREVVHSKGKKNYERERSALSKLLIDGKVVGDFESFQAFHNDCSSSGMIYSERIFQWKK